MRPKAVQTVITQSSSPPPFIPPPLQSGALVKFKDPLKFTLTVRKLDVTCVI